MPIQLLCTPSYCCKRNWYVYICIGNYGVYLHNDCLLDFICYDDACHLRKYSQNGVRADVNEHTKLLASVEMVVDKMHMQGHTDECCRNTCNAANFDALNKVFYIVSAYKLTQAKLALTHHASNLGLYYGYLY